MKIIFMGTPEFACPPLEALCLSNHEIAVVVTGPDRRRGRGRKLQATAVAETAEKAGLPIIKAGQLKNPALHEQLKSLEADLIVVIAFRILPPEITDIPKLGAINVHASLLPKYRGAAPINWALINGEAETGLTSFYLKSKVDTGDIIHQEKIEIQENENFDSLHDRLSQMARPFLNRTLGLIENGVEASVQDDAAATPAPKITPFDALIDFGLPAKNVVNFVRGLSTRPGAYTLFRGKKLKILSAKQAKDGNDNLHGIQPVRPGTISCAGRELRVRCADTDIVIGQVLPQGKKSMDGRSFLNGFQPKNGEILGEIKQGQKE